MRRKFNERNENDFDRIRGFTKFLQCGRMGVNKVNVLEGNKKVDPTETHFAVSNLIFLKKATRKLKGEGKYKIRPPSADCAGNGISIEIHGDAGGIVTKSGSRAQIGICGFLRKQITEKNKNDEDQHGIAVPWVSNKSHTVSTSSSAWGAQALFYCFDMNRTSKGILSELLFGHIRGGNTNIFGRR